MLFDKQKTKTNIQNARPASKITPYMSVLAKSLSSKEITGVLCFLKMSHQTEIVCLG
jgi:hypothetical protein